MARASSSSTKFASVNLNKSYGKPAAAQGAQVPGSGAGRTRIASHGGMLLLTRPVRSQPAGGGGGAGGAAAAAVQKGAKLTVPLPVNLPSLRREHAGNDPNIALVGATGASGWPKQQQKEAEEAVVVIPVVGESNAVVSRPMPTLSSGSTWGTSLPPQTAVNPPPQFAPVNGELRLSSSPQMVARSGVYTPPRARAVQVPVNAVPLPTRPSAVEKAVVLRGEDFPTLQAALPPPPPLPQHRQKELQQKQREKQQELKDQHQKLQLLSQKQPGDESLQPQMVVLVPVLQPSQPVSLQPRREQPPLKVAARSESGPSLEPQAVAVGHAGSSSSSRSGFRPEGFSSYGPHSVPVRVNQRSNWTDDEREPAQSLRPQGGQSSHYIEWPDRPEREHFLEDPRRNSRAEDYGFGRQSSQRERENPPSFGTGTREGGFGKSVDLGRDSGFGGDGGYAREGNLTQSYNLANNHSRDERYGREGMGVRDGFHGRDGGEHVERGGHGKDGGYNRDSGMGRDGGYGREGGGGGYGRHGSFGRDGSGAGREFVGGRDINLDRDGFSRSVGGRDFINDRESFSLRDGFGKESGPREGFYREASYGRDSSFNRDGGYGRDNRRPQSGGHDGGRGRYGGGDRFGRGGGGRFNAGTDFNSNEGGPFASGKAVMGLDSGVDFNRERRFGMPYSEDTFSRDFPDLPRLDFRTSSGLGEALTGIESKLIRKKKEEAKVSAFYDSEREAFEAELERVQKLQEQERLRKLEEKERAIEQARKEQEEQERLAREEVERLLRLEQEAREAVARAEQEVLEAARKSEEDRKAREEEKRSLQLEEDRRKENARRKLLELEERIAKREAELKQKDQETLMPEDDRLRFQRQSSQIYESALRRDVADLEENERIVGSPAGADQDDDDRAPLRPSRRPTSPPMSIPSQKEFSSRVKSPDLQNAPPAGRRMPDLRGGTAFEADRSRSFVPWRRDYMDNGAASSHTPHYGRDEGPEFQYNNMPRDRMYPGRGFGEREAFYGSANSALASDGGPADFPVRKDRVQGYQERRWQADEPSPGPLIKRAGSPHPMTPETDGGFLESSYDRDVDRHWGRDKIDRQRGLRGGKKFSPPPPLSFEQGHENVESTSYGRLRQSVGKQPRVPPPLRSPMHRPPMQSPRDLGSPSPLLHPVSDDVRGHPWLQDGPPESQSLYQSRSFSSRSHPSESSLASSKQSEPVQRETSSSHSERSQGKEIQGPVSSVRPQRTYLQSAKGSQSESQDEGSEQQVAAVEKEPSSPVDDSSVPPATSESHEELGDDSDEDASRSPRRTGPGKSEEDEADYAEDEEEDDRDGEEELEELGLDENDLDDENDLLDEEELDDDELDPDDEGDLDDEEVAGEWEDNVDVVNNEGRKEIVAADFAGDYDSGPLADKEDSGSDIDYKDYEHSSEQRDEDVTGLKHDYDSEVDFKGTVTEEASDLRHQEVDLSRQSMGQPFIHHIGPSVALTPVVPVQAVQGETYGSQVQHPLSFMALSLPQSSSASSQGPSVVSMLQNPQEGPVTLQFGLLPSSSLLPSSVPAIQIGSIQMPLHLHPQSGPQMHGSQAPLFQFGQLGHQTPLPAFVHPSSLSQSVVQPQSPPVETIHRNGPSVQEALVPDLEGEEVSGSQGDQEALHSTKSTWASQLGQNVSRDLKSTDADANEIRSGGGSGLRPERRGRDRGGGSAPHIKALQRVDSEGAMDSSPFDNSGVAPSESLYDNSQGGDGPWQRPYGSGRGRGTPARWTGPNIRGRGRSGSYVGRGVALDGSGGFSGKCTAEGVIDVGPVRTRPNRRSSYRRAEFKVRDSLPSDRGFPDSLGSGREKFSNPSGWTDASDSTMNRDSHLDLSSQYHDRKYYAEPGQSSYSLSGGRPAQSSNKMERSGSSDAPLKTGGFASSRPVEGVLGKYSAENVSDSPMEAVSEEDDFIEVRSKRQMLNERREQKEKEMKAKSKDMKAKEHAARKQRPPTKAGFQGESGVGTGSKSSGLVGPEKRSSIQSTALDANNSSNSRLNQSAISSAVVPSASLSGSNTPAQPLPPIGTPSGGSADMAYDKRSKNTKARVNAVAGGPPAEDDIPASSAYDNQDTMSGTPLAWGGTRSTLQVVSLTQIQLEEAMKPVRFEASVPQQLPFVERSALVSEPVASIRTAAGKDKTSASPSGPLGSLLAGEKIQFGAVTSPPIPLPSSRPLTPGLNAVVGSSLGPRPDGMSDDNELKSKSKRLQGTGNDVSPFSGKTKRTRGDDERGGDGLDAEAEAAASAVAVAAISSDESVGSTHHGDGQNVPLRGVGIPGQGSKPSFGKSSTTSLHSISMGDANASSGLDESITVALPADLSVEPTTISLEGSVPNSSGLLLPSLPGGPLPYRGLEMGTMLGGPMFGFGTSKDAPQGPQGSVSGVAHDQGIASAGSGSAAWQPQHSGGVDSYYAGPPSGYAGPFINPTGPIPSIQGPPHMLVYTNPFASVSQFGQLGVSFLGPQQYLPSGKPPDWKHTPVTTAGPGVVGLSSSESGSGLGGIMSAPRSTGVASNNQRMAPGPSGMSTPSPFDLNLSAPFQIPGVEVSMQSQWSHVPGSQLHTVPISGHVMGFAMQSRHPRPTHIGHHPHMMETSSGFNMVPASNPVSAGLFQSVDPAAQFPDELGLGDSSSSVTNTSSPFRGQRAANRAPPVSSIIVTSSGAPGVGVSSNKLRSGRRAARVARGGSSLGGGSIGGSNVANVGIGSNSGTSAQVANGSRAPSPHLQSPSQMPAMSLGQHSHANPYSDQRAAPQQGLPRVGISSGVWAGQGRKGGGPGRPPVSERGSSGSGEKTSVPASSKLKQVYVVKPSSSPRRNMGDPSPNLFSGSDVGQAALGH